MKNGKNENKTEDDKTSECTTNLIPYVKIGGNDLRTKRGVWLIGQ